MARQVLTDRMLKALRPAPAGKRMDFMDAVVPGFGVRVTDKADASGKAAQRTFILIARYPGKSNPARRAIGEYEKISLEQARGVARRWHELIGKGIDPRQEEGDRQSVEEERRANTFGAVAEDYIKRHLHGQRRARVTEYEIRRDLMSRWGNKPITDITKRDVVTFVDAIVDRGAKGQAHNLFGHARAIFNWAINRGIYGLEVSPCDRLKPSALIGERGRRQRVLSDAELCAVWKMSEGMGHPYGPLVRLLIITGQRKSDAAKAEWSDIDLDNRLWIIPQERHKSGFAHMVPLSDDAVALVSCLPRFERSNHLFSVDRAPLNGFSSAKEKLDRLVAKELGATPEAWVFHDLRRTVRTRLSSLRIPEPVAEMVIGHAKKGLARIYDQHRYLDEMREALAAWSARLQAIVDPPASNVVSFAAA